MMRQLLITTSLIFAPWIAFAEGAALGRAAPPTMVFNCTSSGKLSYQTVFKIDFAKSQVNNEPVRLLKMDDLKISWVSVKSANSKTPDGSPEFDIYTFEINRYNGSLTQGYKLARGSVIPGPQPICRLISKRQF